MTGPQPHGVTGPQPHGENETQPHGESGLQPAGKSQTPHLAYFWGEDAYGIERAARTYAQRVSPPGETLDTWRASLDDESADGEVASASATKRRGRTLDAIEQHLATAPLFGAGTLVVVRQPALLLAETSARERLLAMLRLVPPGNALCFADLIASGARGPAAKGVLRDAVAEAGGIVREFQVPTAGQLEAWLVRRAAELEITLEPAAANLLAQRVGGHVREADVDRRRRTELADAELQKLALYRPGGSIGRADVEALVTETIPGSTWAFLDAVGARTPAQASRLAERLLRDGTPLPVLLSQLHRRLRDLIVVREHIDAGSRPPEIVKAMKLQPFRARKLSEQAGAWSIEGLEAALSDLLELDLHSKGIALDGAVLQMSDAIDALALQVWLARHAAGREPAGAR